MTPRATKKGEVGYFLGSGGVGEAAREVLECVGGLSRGLGGYLRARMGQTTVVGSERVFWPTAALVLVLSV